jgi:hypothetical protein
VKECEGMFEKEWEIPFDYTESLCWMESSFIFFRRAVWLWLVVTTSLYQHFWHLNFDLIRERESGFQMQEYHCALQ